MAKKETQIGTCPYCLRENQALTSKEHVVPSKWFTHGSFTYKKPIIIYTCEACNNAKAPEDEWMRMWLATATMHKSPAAETLMMGKVKDSVEQGHFRKQFAEHFAKMKLTNRLPSGIVLPSDVTQIHVPDADKKRLRSYVNTLVKGLYCEKYGAAIPKGFGLKTAYMNDEWGRVRDVYSPLIGLIDHKDIVRENQPVFLHGMSKSVDSEHLLCVTWYFDMIGFLTVIGPVEETDGRRLIKGMRESDVDED